MNLPSLALAVSSVGLLLACLAMPRIVSSHAANATVGGSPCPGQCGVQKNCTTDYNANCQGTYIAFGYKTHSASHVLVRNDDPACSGPSWECANGEGAPRETIAATMCENLASCDDPS